MKDIAIYGAGGFGKEVLCLINSINQQKPIYNFIGFFDDNLKIGSSISDYKVLGSIDELNSYNKPLCLVIAIGKSQMINNIVHKIQNNKIEYPNLIAPNVVIFDKSKIKLGKGNIITFNCLLSVDVKIGDFNIINCSVCLGHDVTIGNNNILNPSVKISGNAVIGDSNFFGVCSVVLQGKKIGMNTTIGANSVIMRNTKDNCLYLGNPAIHIKI